MKKNQALHAFIKGELLDRIKSGQYKKGDQIPTESDLCKEFSVSRTTVRTALTQLTLEGNLVRKQGKGTFVAGPKLKQTLSHTIKRYRDQVSVQGKRAEITLVAVDVIPALDLLKEALKVEQDAPVQRIERIRSANGEPTQYETAYIPWDIAPGITRAHAESSLYVSLKEDFDVRVSKTTENIEIVLSDERISDHLQCDIGTPLFYMETIAENSTGQIIEFSNSYFRGDKINFLIERVYAEIEEE